ncbi:hypothetical protein BDW75DRAFT_181384 [Aspergillus navahoensis]
MHIVTAYLIFFFFSWTLLMFLQGYIQLLPLLCLYFWSLICISVTPCLYAKQTSLGIDCASALGGTLC